MWGFHAEAGFIWGPEKPTCSSGPGATLGCNCCGLVVLWDKRLLSRHSGAFYSLPIPIYRPHAFLSSLPPSDPPFVKLSTDSPRNSRQDVWKWQDESDIPIPGLGMSRWIMWRAPLSSSFLLPDCWNSSSHTKANALKLFFWCKWTQRPFRTRNNNHKKKKIHSEAMRGSLVLMINKAAIKGGKSEAFFRFLPLNLLLCVAKTWNINILLLNCCKNILYFRNLPNYSCKPVII